MEHDTYDQFVLVQTLAYYARATTPRTLELIDIDHFPSTVRFIGLGQLPPEALRLLWRQRRAVTEDQLALAVETWDALTSEDPRALADLMRSGTPALPNLSGALHRHLRELPSVRNGLSLTQQMLLEALAAGATSIRRAFQVVNWKHDPLPGYGDLMFLNTVEEMAEASEKVFERSPAASAERFDDELAITDLGRSVLSGQRDWMTLQPLSRWVGGVHIDARRGVWRWDEASRRAILS